MAIKPIEEVATVNPKQPKELAQDLQQEVGFVPMASVGTDGSVVTVEVRPAGQLLKGYSYFADGDVIVAKITPCLQNGKAALIAGLPSGHGFGSTEFHVIRPDPNLDPRYLFHMVWTPMFRRFGQQRFTGSAGQKRMPTRAVCEFKIPVPFADDPRRSLAEQKRIAAILDAADALRAKRRESLAQLDTLLQSTFLDMFGDPVANPMGWDVVPLQQATNRDLAPEIRSRVKVVE